MIIPAPHISIQNIVTIYHATKVLQATVTLLLPRNNTPIVRNNAFPHSDKDQLVTNRLRGMCLDIYCQKTRFFFVQCSCCSLFCFFFGMTMTVYFPEMFPSLIKRNYAVSVTIKSKALGQECSSVQCSPWL